MAVIVTSEGIKVEITLERLIKALQSLDASERQAVREALESDWTEELEALLARFRARFQQAPLSDEELDAEIEAGREAYFRRCS